MPQASEALRAKFPDHDREALEVLEKNFTETRGVIRRKDLKYKPTQREWDAIDYLFHEWDYTYRHHLVDDEKNPNPRCS